MAQQEIPYHEGDLFAVPMRDGGYAIGLVARMNGEGPVLGYFFGGRYDHVPDAAELRGHSTDEAIFAKIFGDLGLIRGAWPVAGRLPGWRRDDWPMPAFGRREPLTGRCFRVEYADDDPASLQGEMPISPEELEHLPEDGLAGVGFIETPLSWLLSGDEDRSERGE
jgi:hypothetical protein